MSDRPLQIVWFKRDLRASDHAALDAAAARGPVLPLYIAEPALWTLPDMSARHWTFIRMCLTGLRADLAALGQPLIVRTGRAVEILSGIQKHHRIGGLWSHEETGNEWTFARDREVAAWCRANGLTWVELPQNGVVRRLSNRDGWARQWDRFMAAPMAATPPALEPLTDIAPGPIPTARDLALEDPPGQFLQPGGRGEGLKQLESFLTARGQHYRYQMSSPLTAEAACSRLSPHLAQGTLSMREVTRATWKARAWHIDVMGDAASSWRKSLTSFQARLHWHCHFMQKLEDQPDLEHKPLHPAYDGLRGEDPDRLRAWAAGETGWPFVDACMRKLIATGWINFRMRAMLMSVASYHLWMDWRLPGEHLARLFTDYEPGIHWPQVQMQSGTTGINLPRIYNPVKQGYEQDPDGVFVRRWIPELAPVPDRFIHEPWLWEDAPARLWEIYPRPVLDHLDAARRARHAIWALRKDKEFREVAETIQHRHGSRKGKPRRRTASAQLPLFEQAGS